MARFKVATSSAHMPNSCWGRYLNVAVCEMAKGCYEEQPTMISDRARNVVRVVEQWGPVNVGKTDRCASARVMAEAEKLAAQLNAVSSYI